LSQPFACPTVHHRSRSHLAGGGYRESGDIPDGGGAGRGAMAEAVAAVDYLPQVRPKVAVSMHRKLLSAAGMSIHYPQLGARGARRCGE